MTLYNNMTLDAIRAELNACGTVGRETVDAMVSTLQQYEDDFRRVRENNKVFVPNENDPEYEPSHSEQARTMARALKNFILAFVPNTRLPADRWAGATTKSEDKSYRRGWNDCRSTMISNVGRATTEEEDDHVQKDNLG